MRHTIKALAVLTFGLVIVTNVAKADEIAKTFEGATVKRLVVDQAAGPVTVRGTDLRPASVHATKIRFDAGCTLTVELSGSELKVVNKAPDVLPPPHCVVAIRVDLPWSAGPVGYDLSVGSGDVTLERARGILTYKVGAGNVSVAGGELSQVDGRSGSGNVVLDGSWETADLKIGAGNAEVSMTRTPARGHLNLKLGTGNATVRLPRDARIKSSFKAGMGSMTNEFVDQADAMFSISAAAGTGDLSIRKMGKI